MRTMKCPEGHVFNTHEWYVGGSVFCPKCRKPARESDMSSPPPARESDMSSPPPAPDYSPPPAPDYSSSGGGDFSSGGGGDFGGGGASDSY